MALDFPSNPADGEVFGSYVWSASKGVWQSREESAAPAVVSPVPPTTPNSGDIWVDSSDGVSYVYYDDGSSGQWIEMISSGVPNLNEIMPVGTITQTARVSAPTGWLLCQGQSLLVADYSALYGAIGYTYGGSGSNFLLPDLRGRVPVGQKTGTFANIGGVGGAETVQLQTTNLPSHSHTFSGTTASSGAHTHGVGSRLPSQTLAPIGSSIGAEFLGNSVFNAFFTNSAGAHTHTFSGTTGSEGSGVAHDNLQPYIVLNYMIKV